MARKSIQHIHDKFCVTPKINEAEAEINQKAAVIDQESQSAGEQPKSESNTAPEVQVEQKTPIEPEAQNGETLTSGSATGQLEQSDESDTAPVSTTKPGDQPTEETSAEPTGSNNNTLEGLYPQYYESYKEKLPTCEDDWKANDFNTDLDCCKGIDCFFENREEFNVYVEMYNLCQHNPQIIGCSDEQD